jgi:hypothetical protein
MSRRSCRWILAAAIACACLGPQGSVAYFLYTTHPGSPLTMNVEMGTTQLNLIGGTLSWNQVFGNAMSAWNVIGIGPNLDHNFLRVRSPTVSGDACSRDAVNEVRFATMNCDLAFGTALAVTQSWSLSGSVFEVEMLFDNARAWNAYSGPLRPATGGGTLYDLQRVAIHELGHAAGLDHPDEHGQTVVAIMNSTVSGIDAPQADDINGAHAIAWSASAGTRLNTIGTRGSVTTAATMYGGFTLANATDVMIAVRGPSLQTLGVTQNPLDAPGLRLFDAAGKDLLFNANGGVGVATCLATNGTAVYYATTRGQPLNARDTCTSSRNLPAGAYTFTIVPTSTDASGEVLFEVTFNPGAQSGGSLSTIGSRGTVSTAATMYGGFTLADSATVTIAVRGPSLQTLGVTQDPLDVPGLRLFDAAGRDLLRNTSGGVTVGTCPSTNSTASYYANVRGEPLNARDTCLESRRLDAGGYTFTITPLAADTTGEVLFEVTFSP